MIFIYFFILPLLGNVVVGKILPRDCVPDIRNPAIHLPPRPHGRSSGSVAVSKSSSSSSSSSSHTSSSSFAASSSGSTVCHDSENPASSHGSSGSVAVAHSSSSATSSSSHASSSSYAASSSGSVCHDTNRCNDKNAIFKKCPNPCPPTCENPAGVPNCLMMCQDFGCECKEGYVKLDNRCILPTECPDYLRCNGDRNTTFKECPNPCPPTCQVPVRTEPCSRLCLREGCECITGYVLDENGKCILSQDCPIPDNRCDDPNAVYEECTSLCPATCQYPGGVPCVESCGPPGCVCASGYILNENGLCVQLQNCSGAQQCSSNETFVTCYVRCPSNYCPSDDSLGIIACSTPYPCSSGCQCNEGYLRNNRVDRRCVLTSECPEVTCTRQNEEFDTCPSPCRNDRCSDLGTTAICDLSFYPCRPQCVCMPGYYRNNESLCVPPDQCVPDNRCDDPNAMYEECTSLCPATCQYPGGVPCVDSCGPPGCVCASGYILNENGLCVQLQNCSGAQQCSSNETFVPCYVRCPSNYCPSDDSLGIISCSTPYPCSSGCQCNEGYLRNNRVDRRCVLTSECPEVTCTRQNEEFDTCPSPCRNDRCSDLGTTAICDLSFYPCRPQCVCMPGYYRNNESLCVPPDQCVPDNRCDDPNAVYEECTSLCPATCQYPGGVPCVESCGPPGCVCASGYILNENGLCVQLQNCSGAQQCSSNETFVPCYVRCPSNYCPSDDSLGIISCSTPYPCSSGCQCNEGYLRNNRVDRRCVLTSECPEVTCTRQNEEFDTCPSPCRNDRCSDLGTTAICDLSFYPCRPQCVCMPGYYRNNDSLCVPPDQCVPDIRCNDPNAIYEECTSLCPATCQYPGGVPCVDSCGPPGCVCALGYILNENGVCVQLQNCSGASRCSVNETFAPCNIVCPTDYCPMDDERRAYACDYPYPCESGCICKREYVRLYSTGQCILAYECPPVNCTRPNEEWNGCPQSILREYCSYIGKEITEDPDYCDPRCVCKPGFYRNNNDDCIPESECGDLRCNDPNAVFKTCPNPCPATCEYPGSKPCDLECEKEGCECQPGFVRNDDADGMCVPWEQCPGAQLCSSNETFVFCYVGCPNNYCPSDDSLGIIACSAPYPCSSGCQCKGGYLRNNRVDRRCVLTSECPEVTCTRQNEEFDTCPSPCRNDRCSDLGTTAICDLSFYPCRPQCVCMPGYYRNNDSLCVPPDQCVPDNRCDDPNAIYEECTSLCPATCQYPGGVPCVDSCGPPGCVCASGYILNENGLCVQLQNCFGAQQCSSNETFVSCYVRCPSNYCPSDDSLGIISCSTPYPCSSGCQCNEGYLRNNRVDRRCVLTSECPEVTCTRQNEEFDTCPSPCRNDRCSDLGTTAICDLSFYPCRPQCVCMPGYYRNNDSLCVPPDQCGDVGCNGDPNAVFKECPNPCPGTCTYPEGTPCEEMCQGAGCDCKDGFYKNDVDGMCVDLNGCPGAQQCSSNETFVSCYVRCPSNYCPSDDSLGIISCSTPYPCSSGCQCNEGYLRNNRVDRRCVLTSECPEVTCTRQNEEFDTCPSPCRNDRCSDLGTTTICDLSFYPCRPQCVCMPGYYRNNNSLCVPPDQCGDVGCNGDPNAVFKECPNPCPGTCTYPEGTPCEEMCQGAGCDCKDGFYKNDVDGMCVDLNGCPGAQQCSSNETFVSCYVRCPSNYCPSDDSLGIISCSTPYPCSSGCQCNEGYLRNNRVDRRCVLTSECPEVTCTRQNEEFDTCPSPCRNDRCSDLGTTAICDLSFYPCRPQCVCMPGYYRNNDSLCVPPDQCGDVGCNGDPNAVFKECPNPCPGTCTYPGGTPCEEECQGPGCECKDGFYKNNEDGMCVQLKDCPGAEVCPLNETFVFCNAVCPPTQFCPEDDGQYGYACDQPYPCESGCACKNGYRRVMQRGGRCILANECPVINCTRDNEVWDSCPPYQKRSEFCSEIGQPVEDPGSCDPRCVCAPGFKRNNSDICIPEGKCPADLECGLNEMPVRCRQICPPQDCAISYTEYACGNDTTCEPGCDCVQDFLRNDRGICIHNEECPPQCDVPIECRPTCANPKPKRCPIYTPSNENIEGCKCMAGYILSESNGVCIRVGDCPVDQGCNGDPNSIVTSCPWPCPSTCLSPNAGNCGKECDVVGCQCKSGFILNPWTRKCIRSNECRRGNPCGRNETFVDCAYHCPNQNCPVNDNQYEVLCRPGFPCPSGCLCKDYYKRNKDNTCVLASDCPAIECTRPNEVWNPCASECLADKCIDIFQPYECYPDPERCIPKCVCSNGYYRDEAGNCIPERDCKPPCPILPECRPTCAVPNPPGCSYVEPPPMNIDDCHCQKGYVLSEPGGSCIMIENCPTNITCNGDPNARVKECPLPCPSTCTSPNAQPCKRMCEPIGCECKPGYLQSDVDGLCIHPDNCTGGNPCGRNATFVPCRYNCPTNYCPVDESRVIPICEFPPFAPCYPGCACLLNHRLKSREEPICIESADCKPLNCTSRPNEVWNRCPVECGSEYCEYVDRKIVCNTLVLNCNPRCFCKKNYFRNPKTDLCVSARECRKFNWKHPPQS